MRIYTVVARKDYPEDNIKKGDTYHYCEPQRRKTGGVRKIRSTSKQFVQQWISSYMSRFQGEFSSNIQQWEDQLLHIDNQQDKDQLIEEIDTFLDEKQSNLDNIPYQLQESHILNEQIEQLQDLLQQAEELEVEDE